MQPVSYIQTPAATRFPWYVRLLFYLQRRRFGSTLEPARLWGRSPLAFAAMASMYVALDRKSSPLDPTLRSLLQVRVSQINGCAHCIDLNSAVGLNRGIPEAKLRALMEFPDSGEFSDLERTALEYAEAMTDSNRSSGAELVTRLQRHFADDAIIELTALIAFQNMSSKFNAALGVPAQGFCVAPRR